MKTISKVLALLLVITLTVSVAVNATLAYLQEQDEAVNVMTVGNVHIDQSEQERVDGSAGTLIGNLRAFTQEKGAYPYTGPVDSDGVSTGPDFTGVKWNEGSDRTFDLFSTADNVIDKFITVKNTGLSDAYVRTLIAFEEGANPGDPVEISAHINDADWTWTWLDAPITLDGSCYRVAEAVWKTSLKPGSTTLPSLLQVYLNAYVTNEDVATLGDTWEIMAVSQAVQTQGFSDARTALDTAFGKLDAATAAAWFGNIPVLGDYPEAVPDANGVVTVESGQTMALTGSHDAVTIQGQGTLVLQELTITATGSGASALRLAEGSDVTLRVEGTVRLTGAQGGNGIYVPAGTTLDLSGNTLAAIGNSGSNEGAGGSGIGGEGRIYIHDMRDLTAAGYGPHGFGIGGATASITIEDTHIYNVQGGYVQPQFVNDTKYGKSEPEGGAAIGSSVNGATITLSGVTIDNAAGGSKAAGIGARYHTGVTIVIENSAISVTGGNASAGIGGSRVSGAPNGEDVSITISDSTITAVGGQFGAGIGSGYDTHCNTPATAPMCTIRISGNSTIKAAGGKYAAGIGTGYHNGQLSGSIDSTVNVTAVSGEKIYKNTYTQAMDVGFGVIDPSRDGLNNTCTFNFQGQTISLPQVSN